jgi:hypothetical protein
LSPPEAVFEASKEASMHGGRHQPPAVGAGMHECMNVEQLEISKGAGWEYHFRKEDFATQPATDATFDRLVADQMLLFTETDRAAFHEFIQAVRAAWKTREITKPFGFIRAHVVKRPGQWKHWLAARAPTEAEK